MKIFTYVLIARAITEDVTFIFNCYTHLTERLV